MIPVTHRSVMRARYHVIAWLFGLAASACGASEATEREGPTRAPAPEAAPQAPVAASPPGAPPTEAPPTDSPQPPAPEPVACEWDGDCELPACGGEPCPIAICASGRCESHAAVADVAERERIGEPYPPNNRPDLQDAPRPPLGEAEARTRLLWDAIVRDDPSVAEPFFFPRDAFLLVKAIPDPGRYWDRLHARFIEDVHTLHRTVPDLDRAELVGLDLVRRGGFIRRGEEGNALPYWASRHSRLLYRVDGEERAFEVRVLITWDDVWYVIHLNEFH